ncbi:MAG: branched-chain amino acid ABC transporter permease [Ardenticatenia bacterium]|nr:MAG: branched-chain amino acid ABC transporter permease [Ardenticatenia bacterium]
MPWRERFSLTAVLVVAALAGLPWVLALLGGTDTDSGLAVTVQLVLINTFILAVYAVSYDLLMGYTGILSFGHALFFGTGAYALGITVKHFGWPIWGALVLVVVLAVVQAFLVGVLSLRVRGIYFTMVTLALAEGFYRLAQANDFAAYTGAKDGLHGIPLTGWLSRTDHFIRFYLTALLFLLVMYWLARRLVNSPAGRAMQAVRENESRAAALGFNPLAYKLVALVVAGVMAALAGAFNALWQGFADPGFLSVDMTIEALLMVIIGGVGTLVGPILGAGVLEILGDVLNRLFGPRWPLVFGLAYVLIVLYFPYGLLGTWRQRAPQRRAGWARLRRLVVREG